MKDIGRTLAAAFLCVTVAACPLFPRKAELDAVHEAYRADFATVFVDNTNEPVCQYSTAFDRSLEAIRGFDAKYREKSAEKDHVTVLKGMVHLQAGHFGLARLLIPQVTAASFSGSSDREVRDGLFKTAYTDLVNGWQAACESVKPDTPTVVRDGTFTADSKNRPRSAVLEEAATSILGTVKGSAQARSSRGGEADDGAIYLAASGSIFQYHVVRMKEDACRGRADVEACTKPVIDKAGPNLQQGVTAIYALLTADEQKAAMSQTACLASDKKKQVSKEWGKAPTRARQRYVDWVAYIQQKAKLPCPQPAPT